MNPSDIFKSMEEIKEVVNYMKTYIPGELWDTLEIAFGIGKQEGIVKTIKGIGEIDTTIAEMIKNWNDIGYKTLASCSGLSKDHPNKEVNISGYVSFLYIKKQANTLSKLCKELNIKYEEGECYLKPSISIYIDGSSDDEKLRKWDLLNTAIITSI